MDLRAMAIKPAKFKTCWKNDYRPYYGRSTMTFLRNLVRCTPFILVGAFIGAACTILPSRAEKTPGPSPPQFGVDESGMAKIEPVFTNCPEQDWLFHIDYTHHLVAKQGNIFRYEMNSEPDSAFMVTIRKDGRIDGDDFDNRIPVSITGFAEDCTFEGTNMLHADMMGFCSDGIATIDIVEEYLEGFQFLETCPEGSIVQGGKSLTSAPEVRYDFDLTKDSDTKILEMETGALSFRYTWTLRLAGPPIPP
jgi:hypothetical protein